MGDPRQMPPTSFFQGKAEGSDFEEVSDLESVLESCLALNMPQAYLKWHYRSQHESLIAFSNRRFYEGKMHMFPSADDRTLRVEFQKVDGHFERGGRRVNEAEAVAIVEDVKRRYRDPVLRKMSIGVVDPYDESRYLAGILLDGNTYGLAKTTRDREISHPRLLERLGWRCMRLWALEWWEDAATTTARVLAVLDEAKAGALLDGVRIVGHNARFVLSALGKALHACGVDLGPTTYACTMSLACDLFPDLEKYSLQNVCGRCGVAIAERREPGAGAQARMKAFFAMDESHGVANDRATWLEFASAASRSSLAPALHDSQSAEAQSISELVALAEDVVADGRVTIDEVIGLRWWIERNPLLGNDGVSGELYALLAATLEDGQVDVDEERELLAALRRLIGSASIVGSI